MDTSEAGRTGACYGWKDLNRNEDRKPITKQQFIHLRLKHSRSSCRSLFLLACRGFGGGGLGRVSPQLLLPLLQEVSVLFSWQTEDKRKGNRAQSWCCCPVPALFQIKGWRLRAQSRPETQRFWLQHTQEVPTWKGEDSGEENAIIHQRGVDIWLWKHEKKTHHWKWWKVKWFKIKVWWVHSLVCGRVHLSWSMKLFLV